MGGRGAYTWTNICVLKMLFFCSSNWNVFRFSAHNLSLLLIFLLLLIFNNVLTTVNTTNIAITILQKNIGYQIQCSVFSILLFSPKFNVMFEFSYSKYNPPGAYFFLGGGGSLYMEGVFHSESWFLNAPGLIHSGAYYQNFMVCKYTCSTINILK